MPVVHVSIPEGTFSAQQKQELVARITDALVDIEQVPEVRQFVNVLISEVTDGGWGVGGQVFTKEALTTQFGIGPKTVKK
jgi:4-oxalocrotonate tautomerase